MIGWQLYRAPWISLPILGPRKLDEVPQLESRRKLKAKHEDTTRPSRIRAAVRWRHA